MYYILYEGLKIESNEPVYCTVYIANGIVYIVIVIMYILYVIFSTHYYNRYHVLYTYHTI